MTDPAVTGTSDVGARVPPRSPRAAAAVLVPAALLLIAAISILAEGGSATAAAAFAVAGVGGLTVERRVRRSAG
ncbi:hypothetical protein [Cellulomonas sp. Y8]|uniref:hypothetical protein n=1 Tax=Cellulomonas sp. Y8 TaxID=2591145 RepID=UPI003D74D548